MYKLTIEYEIIENEAIKFIDAILSKKISELQRKAFTLISAQITICQMKKVPQDFETTISNEAGKADIFVKFFLVKGKLHVKFGGIFYLKAV